MSKDTHPTSPDPEEPKELCNKHVYWWDGEYDGDCELPKNHLYPFHYDGISYFDDDNNNRDNEQLCLEAYITQQVTAVRLDEHQWIRDNAPYDDQLLWEARLNNRINTLTTKETKL